ncbi:hypothetical protein LEP1GSC008_2729 [Leptospira kirschneri serovar Bulgarica str. Nikolaevo]|uniref:Uncharacterized protein n=1 Tax=Leptospira kirschneri serovar Bulgarica str. Nikolaevo TaxID=1240687 RepID=M6FIQ9_9LEPT|nr:hypothetical protein LEP1GSC008_2729 [Leptospira kirschneri serovar Bulgarica str. Nikolaevo]
MKKKKIPTSWQNCLERNAQKKRIFFLKPKNLFVEMSDFNR